MDFGETHHLGFRAFIIFLGRHLKWPIILLIVLVLLWTQRGLIANTTYSLQLFGVTVTGYDVQLIAVFAFKVLLLIWLGIVVFVLFRSYFEYKGYSYRFDDEYFHITNGYIIKNVTGVVYHQIQHVTIKRGIFDRVAGVGHVIIVMNVIGNNPGASEIVIPALDKKKAAMVHRELMSRSHHSTKPTINYGRDTNDISTENSEEEES